MRKLQVTWIDSTSYANPPWREDFEGVRCIVNVTLGFELKRTKDHLILAQSVSEEGSLGGVFVIPAGCIKKLTVLK